jgi:DNA repair protein SbcD/Mre11
VKILHTSDLHLGLRLYEREVEPDHRHFFQWLISHINEQQIDLLIISGDIFDIAYPSSQALSLYYEALTRLVKTCLKDVVIIGGNHDSANQLNAPKQILEFLNVHILGGAPQAIEDCLIPIVGEENSVHCVVCAVPYLRDRDLRHSIPGEGYDERKAAFRQGLVAYYENIAEKAKAYKEQNIPVIATGHLFMTDSSMKSEEKELYVGGLQEMTSQQMPDLFDYVALGHIHRCQKVGDTDRIHYCGSPIPVSFSESKQDKFVLQVEICPGQQAIVQKVQVPFRHKLVRFKGSFDEVLASTVNYKSEHEIKDWAEILVEEENFDPLINQKIDKLVAEVQNVEILNYRYNFKKSPNNVGLEAVPQKSLKDFAVPDVFGRLLEKLEISEDEQIKQTFAELLATMNDDKDSLTR